MLITGGISTTSSTYSYSPVRRVDNQGSGTETGASDDAGVASKDGSARSKGTKASGDGSRTASRTGSSDLTAQEAQEVKKLEKRDKEVRAHEQAHMAAGGQYVRGAASYSYEAGPDGRRYAVGGEVSIDVSPVSGDPSATIRKMAAVRRAALAPADPSGQDLRVAASADGAASQARRELMAQVLAAMETAGSSTGKATGNTIDTVA